MPHDFETWIVSEIRKHRANRGEIAGLSYYRDRDGAEADLILERGDGLTIVETKASQTASSSLLDGARRVRRRLAGLQRPCDVLVAYAGDDAQSRSEGELVPWDRLHQREWGVRAHAASGSASTWTRTARPDEALVLEGTGVPWEPMPDPRCSLESTNRARLLTVLVCLAADCGGEQAENWKAGVRADSR